MYLSHWCAITVIDHIYIRDAERNETKNGKKRNEIKQEGKNETKTKWNKNDPNKTKQKRNGIKIIQTKRNEIKRD